MGSCNWGERCVAKLAGHSRCGHWCFFSGFNNIFFLNWVRIIYIAYGWDLSYSAYQLWKSNRKEQHLWPKPCIEAVNTAHPFNQTARLKQTFWRPSPTTTTTGGGGGGFEPPALEIRQPIMHPSFQQAVNDDEERLYFKVGTEHGPTDPVIFNQAVSPIVIKAKVLSIKNKAWYSSPWI